jgi:predicted Zn-dependent protease
MALGGLLMGSPSIAQRAAETPDIEKLYQRGRSAFAAGRAYEAIEVLGAVEAQNPAYRDVQILLGQACLVTNLLARAERHFERALEIDPTNPHSAYLLGLTLYQRSRYFEAEQALATARRLAPQNPHPLIYQGLSLLKLGQPRKARAAIEAALRQAPKEPLALLALAELELAEGHSGAAETEVRKVLSASPSSREAILLLSRILVQADRPAEAVAALEPLRASSRLGSEDLYLLAQALLRSGRANEGRAMMSRFKEQTVFEEKVKVLESTIARDSNDLEGRIQLVSLLLDQGVVGSSPIHLTVLLRKLPADPRVQDLVVRLTHLREEKP